MTMRLTTDEVRHIAALARVGMTDEDIQRMGEEMSHILENFDVLAQVDTDGVEPTGHSVELTSVMRDDEATESLPIDDMLANAPAEQKSTFPQTVEIVTGGAAPPSAVIEAMEEHGFRVTHLYGLTETYGPATVCLPQADWPDLSTTQRSARMARQGVRCGTLEGGSVKNPETMEDVPWDAHTLGEVMVRGNTVMKGYLKNSAATDACFSGGWFHSGDLAVRHPDGYIEVKDRSKDVIISGGENISSLEVEEVLYRHPDVLEAAVVARPDPKWGESPCAFVTLHDGARADQASVVDYCRQHLAHFKAPRSVVFGPLPKTSTGKIQKFLLRNRAAALGD